MRKTLALAVASALTASAFAASPASAQMAPGVHTLETTTYQFMTVYRDTPAITCKAELSLVVDPGGFTGVITGGNLLAPHPYCASLISLTNFSWPITFSLFVGGVASFTITGVGFTLLGPCNNGVLNGVVYPSNVLTITSSTGWMSFPAADCKLTGALTLDP